MKAYRMWLYSDVLEKNKRVFKVPVYQRNYDWSNEQCKKLYNDIIKANETERQHFMGTIVYIADSSGGSGLNEVLIIDGQQRITTVYILLKAIYDSSKGKSVRIEDEVKEIMYNRHCDEKYKVKLKPVKTDNEQLGYLIKDKIDKMDRNSNVYKNYIAFQEMIESSLNAGLELNDILNGIKKLEVVEIILDKSEGDEPQKIFESINSTGLELSLADLIRNFLLMDDEKQDEFYEEYWVEIEKNVGYRNLGDFVINYLNYRTTKNVNNKNAYKLFKEHYEENKLTHEIVLKHLKRASKYYGSFIGENNFYSENITTKLSAFYAIKQTTVVPLLFKILDDYEEKRISEDVLCNVLDYLLTYFVRIISCEINKNLNKFMKSMYDRVIVDSYDNYYERFFMFLNDLRANDRMPTDQEFKEALINKPLYKKTICKYLLSVIENSTKEHIDISNLTIEHILPQKENAAVWKKEVGDNYSSVYEKYLHTLGNLTITGNNSELGTKSFNDKKKIIQENSKANILNKEVLSAEKWNEESILYRANVLSDKLITVFDYVDLHSDDTVASDLEFNVDSDIDFANTKPAGFSFAGEYIKTSNWIDLLTKFITLSYDLDEALFKELAVNNYSLPSTDKTYITNDNRKLRKAKQINGTGIFFESNLSANTIISFVKNILEKMDIDTDEFSFSLSEVPFDIHDESTWEKGHIPVAKLFFNLIENLIENNVIHDDEIDKLKTKEYTKSIFKDTDYPAVADNRNDNKGKSNMIRYRAKAINFNGRDIFVSTQFFDSDRDNIIEWYKKHF